MSESIEIRPFQENDLEQIARLYNAGGFGPITGGQALTAHDLHALLIEKGTYLFLVAEDQEEKTIVGTLGVFLQSEQRVARPGEVYASSFFIEPEHRNGLLPSRLFMHALWSLLQDGYTTISATVSPANMVALALYKRIGLYRLQSSQPDYDGQIELRGYQPLIMRAIQCLYPADLPEMPHRESPWRFLAPTRTLRTNSPDSEYWHGLEVVTYEINAEQLHFFFRIDVESGGLVELQANAVHFCMHPDPSARVLVGKEGHLVCELTNTAPEPRIYGLSLADRHAAPLLALRTFQAQETWRQEIPFTFMREGFHVLETTLHMDRQTQGFRLGVVVNGRISCTRVRPLQMLESGRSAWISVRLVNETDQPLPGVLRVLAPTLTHLLVSPDQVNLPARGATELTLFCEGIDVGLHAITIEVQTPTGEHLQTPTLIQPVLGMHQEVVYEESNEYVLEFVEVRACVDKETGYMRIWEKSSERLVLYEAWPNVGPPLPGGLKRSPKRVLTRLPATENVLTLVESIEGCGYLQRSLHLLSSGRLEINHTWTPTASGAKPYLKLKTFGECAFRQDTLTVPLLQGWHTRAVVYGAYPYRLHEYEAIPSADLPRLCCDYAENWSAFDDHGLTAGMLWQNAAEVCFGGHWMPSLLFELGEGTQPISLPRYAYVIGYGGAERVIEHWRQFSALVTQSSGQERDVPQRSSVTDRGQMISLLRELSDHSVVQHTVKPSGSIRYPASGQDYRVENGTLGLRIAPDTSGVITALTYKGSNLLRTAGPRPKPFGDNSVWLGGIHPARIHKPPNLLGSLLCDPSNLVSWQVEPILTTDEQSWQGIALTQDTLRIRYEMQPWKPTLRLSVEYYNVGAVTQTFYLLFHLFFRSMQHQIPEKVYYERNGTKSCLIEERKTRREYVNDWSIIASGKNLALALWAEPETHLEIATYEWPRDGFQHILMLPFQVAPGEVQRAYCHLLVTDSLTQLLSSAGFTSGNTSASSLQERVSHILV